MDRKYGHKGYQDSGRDDRDRSKAPPQKPLTPEERAQLRSLRHAVQREANEVVRCPNCGRNIPQIGVIVPDTACPHCNTPLHSCRACRHFDSGARWECRAPIAERVADKGKANACPQFDARRVLDATGKRTTGNGAGSGDPKSQFDSLFKR